MALCGYESVTQCAPDLPPMPPLRGVYLLPTSLTSYPNLTGVVRLNERVVLISLFVTRSRTTISRR